MRTQLHPESGIAMFLCIFALLLLSAIGMALMFTSDTETGINSNFRSSQAAYYASKAGLEEGRDRIRYGQVSPPNPTGWVSIPLPSTLPSIGSATGVYYITNPGVVGGAVESVQPWNWANKYHDDELCHENFTGLGLPVTALGVPCTSVPPGTWYTAVSSADPNSGTIAAMPYKWVRITQKTVQATAPYCVDGSTGAACTGNNTPVCATSNGGVPYEVPMPAGAGTCEKAAGNQLKTVYMITALAVTNTGARRMTQYEVASIALPPFPAALTMDGEGPFLIPATSNAFTLTGNDHGNCGSGPMPGIGAVSDPADSQITYDITHPPSGPSRASNYTGVGTASPNVYNVNSYSPPMDSQFKYCTTIQNLYNNISSIADQTFNTNNPTANLGSTAAPLVTVVNGDFTLDSSNNGGAGILVVTGNLMFSGNPSFNGIVLVVGTGSISTANGGGSGNLYGALFLANCFNAAKQWTGSTCDSTNQNPGTGPGHTYPCLPGPPSFNWQNGGGTFNVQYDSCWINKLSNSTVYKILASREEMY